MDRYRVACHEGAHATAAAVLTGRGGRLRVAAVGSSFGGCGGLAENRYVEMPSRVQSIIFMAGGIGATLACGDQWLWIEYDDATQLACQYRAARHRPDAPPPVTIDTEPTPTAWPTTPTDPAAISIATHSGMRADVSRVLELIDHGVTGILDPLDRHAARIDEFGIVQRIAFELCRDHVRRIRALAGLILANDGDLPAAAVAAFFKEITK